MAATLSTDPPLALAPRVGTNLKIVVTLTGGGNYYKLYCTDAPAGSALKKRIDANTGARVLLKESSRSSTETLDTEKVTLGPDDISLGGVYVFTVDEIARGTSGTSGGAYQSDPASYPAQSTISTTQNLKLYVGQRLETALGAGADRATLALYVWDSTITATTFALHQLKSPDIILPTSARAAAAVADSTVQTRLAALAGVAATTALGNLSTVIDDFVQRFNSHLVSAGVHQNNDAANGIIKIPIGTKSPAGLIAAANLCRQHLLRHMTNDDGTGIGTGNYHLTGGTAQAPDYKNSIIAPPAGDLESARILIADIHRAYEAHRVQTSSPASHLLADNTFALAALPVLLQLDSAFLASIQPSAPTVPATSHAGVVTLVSGAGFRTA